DLGITTLINLHFLDLARQYGQRLIGLRAGKLVYDGNINDVNDEIFRQIYGRAITPDDMLQDA
ncbi:ABC transporter, ATP-binding protein (cluster 12, methionine/phosphonates), partial [hydrothermal vent metagenome]